VIDAGGYGAVSMEAIARAAGVTKPVVYGAFGNLGALLAALLEREEERAMAELASALPTRPATDPDQVAVDAFVAFLRAVTANPATWRLILMPAESTPAIVRDRVEAGREQIRQRIEELLVWGVEVRGGPRGLDLELAAQSLVAVGEHLARLALSRPGEVTPERAGEFVRTLLGALQ
jgi:AcrR family transcriptional regulator